MPGKCWEPGLLLLLLLAGCCRIAFLVDTETNTSGSTSHQLRSHTALLPHTCTRTTRICPFPSSQTLSLATTTTQAPADAQGA